MQKRESSYFRSPEVGISVFIVHTSLIFWNIGPSIVTSYFGYFLGQNMRILNLQRLYYLMTET